MYRIPNRFPSSTRRFLALRRPVKSCHRVHLTRHARSPPRLSKLMLANSESSKFPFYPYRDTLIGVIRGARGEISNRMEKNSIMNAVLLYFFFPSAVYKIRLTMGEGKKKKKRKNTRTKEIKEQKNWRKNRNRGKCKNENIKKKKGRKKKRE